MRATIVFIMLVTMLAGCTTLKDWAGFSTPPSGEIRYGNPNFTSELWAHDSYECERAALQSSHSGEDKGAAGALELRLSEDRCLAAKGWTITEAQK